jgi:hypothetical protein
MGVDLLLIEIRSRPSGAFGRCFKPKARISKRADNADWREDVEHGYFRTVGRRGKGHSDRPLVFPLEMHVVVHKGFIMLFR